MTKQEEIREGVANRFRQAGLSTTDAENFAKATLGDLVAQGVVRKVECPDCNWSQFRDEVVGMTPCHSCSSTGYIFEPLIEGK